MKQPIIFFDGDKGGVGKSVACGAFIDWAHKQGLPIALIDGDSRNPDVHRIYDGVIPVALANMRHHDGWMDTIDFIAANPDKIIAISMPAGVGMEMEREAPRFVQMAEEYDRPVALVWVINRTVDSINLLNRTMTAFGGKLGKRFVLKNMFFGSSEKFVRWDTSAFRKNFEKAGGQTLMLHELHERAMDKLVADENNIIPYSQAVVSGKDIGTSLHGLTPSEATELRIWLNDNAGTFSIIAKEIGLIS